MRKSTVIAIAIIIFGAISMLFLFKSYTEQFADDIRAAKELSDDFRDALAKDTKIRLRRTAGAEKYVVRDKTSFGLLVDVTPDAAVLKRDPTGFALSREIAVKAFEIYGSDRPIQWVEIRAKRIDGTELPPIALQRGEGSSVVPIESVGK